jgi:DNA-binding MarR family transcriptional regulator
VAAIRRPTEIPLPPAPATSSEKKSVNNGSESGTNLAHLELLQATMRRAFKLLVTSGDNNTDILDMPLGQVRCLRRIIEQDGCKLVDLARETNLSVPNASRLVDRLVRRGLVVRPTDPTDRRAVRLHATAESKAMIASIQEQRIRHMARATRTLTSAQIDTVITTLEVVIDAAEKSQGEVSGAASFEDIPPLAVREIVE